jgi:hypothetical protein
VNYFFELFCEDLLRCTVRTIIVETREFGGPQPSRSWRCPACGGSASVVREKTGEEDQREKDSQAIARVHELVYLRDGIGPFPRFKIFDLPANWKVEV